MLIYPISLKFIGKKTQAQCKTGHSKNSSFQESGHTLSRPGQSTGEERPCGGEAHQLFATENMHNCSLTHLWSHSEKTTALQVLEI